MESSTKELSKELKGKYMDPSRVEDLQDSLEDLQEQSSEIQDILGRSFDAPDEVDDEEVLGELDALDEELDVEDELPPEASDATPSSYLQEQQSQSTGATIQAAPTPPPPPPQPAAASEQPQALEATDASQKQKEDKYGLPVAPQ